MKQTHRGSPGGFTARTAPLLLLALVACGGSSGKVGNNNINDTRPVLQHISFGRLVDVYAYQRVDETRGDRRDRLNRKSVLIAKDVAISPRIESESLFDAAGEELTSSNYEFQAFDVATGHEDLLILWDNRGAEAVKFDQALTAAQIGLTELAPSYRGQNTLTRPMPVVPRNAALVLRFSSTLPIDDQFFAVNPAAVQLLEFKGTPTPATAADSFRSLAFRTIPRGPTIIIDTTILGGEVAGGFPSSGLPLSVDNVTANIRLAIPSRGGVSPTLYVREDQVAALNGIDSFGRDAVIRDFRSGNQLDGGAAVLRDLEAPMIVGDMAMGVIAVDPTTNVVTLNKRLHTTPVRGRFPFVEGALSSTTLFPLGPAAVPTAVALRAGDYLVQTVQVTMPDNSVEAVRVRSEILWNLEVGTIRGDTTFPGVGLAADGSQGENLATVRVRVASATPAFDSLGRPVGFTSSALPAGADCTLRAYYYERVPFLAGGAILSDSTRRFEYLKIDPAPPTVINGNPVTPGSRVDPNSSFTLQFSEPMDFERIDPTKNFVLTDASMPGIDFAALIADPKSASAGLVPTRLADQSGDNTLVQLQPPKGLFHNPSAVAPATNQEIYFFHVLLGANGPTDLSGNPVAIFNDVSTVIGSWSARLTMNAEAGANLVGWKTYPFESLDEDGTLPGSIDIFGQYRLLNGRLVAAEAQRFSRSADSFNLGLISRVLRGECFDPAGPTQLFPSPGNGNPAGGLYWQPRMVDTVVPPNVPQVFLPPNQPQLVGRVVEPHQPRGSRLMMRYLEDDFDLGYRLGSDMLLDIEQMYWSPFNDEDVLFDVFDRYSMSLSHADKRPDLHYLLQDIGNGLECLFACPSASSSLTTTFLDNPLHGSSQVPVFEDKIYTINVNDSFRSPQNIKYVPYPRFDHSYTWRDSRLITSQNGQVVGLGGARDPNAPIPNNDWTANIDSPWVTDDSGEEGGTALPLPAGTFPGTQWVMNNGDFHGDRKRDHDPIALPLLVDFKMFPDGAANGIANGGNGFQVAMLGPPSAFLPGTSPGGYYSMVGIGCAARDPWPRTRIHTTGGLDPTTGREVLIDPANALSAEGGWLKDSGAIVIVAAGAAGDGPRGIFRAPPGDAMVHWARADFVRKVSSMTFGFFDTTRPNHRQTPTALLDGFPNLSTLGVRIDEMTTLLDPPQSRQPAGTSVVLELRGAAHFGNDPGSEPFLYNAQLVPNGDFLLERGNLLNPSYACEAFRYSTPNSGGGFDSPRIRADGLTAYATEDRLNSLRESTTGLLPRYLNLRLIMTNNVAVSPTVSPSLRSMSLVYRMRAVN